MLDVFWKKLEEVVQMCLFFKKQYFSGSQQLGEREGGRSREIGEGKKSISMREKQIEKKEKKMLRPWSRQTWISLPTSQSFLKAVLV